MFNEEGIFETLSNQVQGLKVGLKECERRIEELKNENIESGDVVYCEKDTQETKGVYMFFVVKQYDRYHLVDLTTNTIVEMPSMSKHGMESYFDSEYNNFKILKERNPFINYKGE